MSQYAIQSCNELHELTSELYEALHTEDGNSILEDNNMEAQEILCCIIAKCKDIIEDVS